MCIIIYANIIIHRYECFIMAGCMDGRIRVALDPTTNQTSENRPFPSYFVTLEAQ